MGVFLYDERHRNNYQYVVVTVGDDSALSRDELMEVLHAENVLARRYFFPGVHRMEPYRSYFPHAHLLLPSTEEVCRQVLILPTGTAVSGEDIAKICEVIRTALDNAVPVRKRLVELRGATP